MPERCTQFADLQRLLRQAGIVDSSARRIVEELHDHYDDLFAAACERGCEHERARAAAMRALGSPADIVAVARECRELLTFAQRHPRLAGLSRGLACAASAPALPVHYCLDRRDTIVRWGASVGLASMVTAALLLSLQSVVGLG